MTDVLDPTAVAVGLDPAGSDDRLNRNAAALVVSGVLTSLFGFLFWVAAARLLSTDDVGTGTAIVAALVLLAHVSTLGLRNAFPRFIPVAGPATGRLIVRGYGACVAVAAVLGTVFVLGSPIWAGNLTLLRESPLGGVAFVVATAAWTIFVLQDSVLTGLRHAVWVPIENLVYAVAKIALLLLVVSTGRWALMLAWAVPAIAVLVPLNTLIFRKMIPSPPATVPARTRAAASFDWRGLVRFSSGDHAADVVKIFGAEGVVLVVLAAVGPAKSAALFFAITITASVQLVTSNIVSAFVAEAAARPDDIESLHRRAALHAARLVVPAALLGAVLAPVALSVFGSDYRANGTGVLRLLLLSLVPQIVTSLAIGVARFERRVGLILALGIGASAPPLLGAVLLAPRYGIVAVGWSVLAAQLVLALVLLRTTLRILRPESAPTRSAPAALIVRHAVTIRDQVRHRRRVRAVASILDELDAVHTTGEPLHPRRVVRNTTDVVVVIVDHPTVPRVIKVALSQTAAFGLADHVRAVRDLRAAGEAADGVRAEELLPEILEWGTSVGQTYLIETACRGIGPLVADHATLAAAAEALAALQTPRRPAAPARDGLLIALIEDPIDLLASDPRLGQHLEALESLRRRLITAVRAQPLVTARTHGDFWLGNVLVERRSEVATVTGIIDWEDSLAVGIPEIDLAHLWLSTQLDGIAAATLRSLDAPTLRDVTGSWIGDPPNPTLSGGAIVLLAWLGHVSCGIDRSSRFSLGHLWLDENVRPVLEGIGG